MNKIIGIFDHESSNSYSVAKALEKIEVKYFVSNKLENLENCYKIIIPGIGNMSNFLNKNSIIEIEKFFKKYLERGGFIYGICLGMQLFFDKSYETKANFINTLGWFSGNVVPFNQSISDKMNVGHKNFFFTLEKNNIFKDLFYGIDDKEKFFFLHKFYCYNIDTSLKSINIVFEKKKIPVLIYKNNVLGTQFHPELSKEAGLKFLFNFSRL